MAKIIYKAVLNNIECSIELLDIEKGDKSDNTIFSYSIGSIGGLAHGDDLLKYIVALETGYFIGLKNCSHNPICFINDLVRAGILTKETYCRIYEGEEKTYDFLTS